MPEHETIVKIKRIGSPIARAHHMQFRCPMPVWDTTGSLVGVAIDCDKKMGPVECSGQATFTLNEIEQRDEAKIKEKTELAVSALKSEVLVSIRPKKKVQKVG